MYLQPTSHRGTQLKPVSRSSKRMAANDHARISRQIYKINDLYTFPKSCFKKAADSVVLIRARKTWQQPASMVQISPNIIAYQTNVYKVLAMNCHLPATILLGLHTRTLDLLTKIHNERGFHSGQARTRHCFFFSA